MTSVVIVCAITVFVDLTLQDEECFYQCEPMLGYFQIDASGYISHVPVCASYCERWFAACRTDLTCVADWLADFDYAVNGNNSCPANSTCTTFEQQYGDARGLCNRMWGDAFFYSEDEDNCTVMAFTGPNPNFQLTFPATVMASTGPTPYFELTFPATAAGAVWNIGSCILISTMGAFASILFMQQF